MKSSHLKLIHYALIYGFHMTGNTDMHLLVTYTFKKSKDLDQTSQYLVAPPFASCSATHLLRVDKAVDCGLCVGGVYWRQRSQAQESKNRLPMEQFNKQNHRKQNHKTMG